MRLIAPLLACLLLSACAVLRGPDRLPEIPLLPPESFGRDLQVSQRVTLEFEGEGQVFLAAWAVTGRELNFAGLTPSGQGLMTLSYGSEGFRESYSALVEEDLPGRQVLSHLQLAHWPLDAISEALGQGPWQIRQTGGQRELYLQGRLALSIAADYQQGETAQLPSIIRIHSHLMPMTLEVQTLQVTTP